jgi:2-keto-4-pentenoate hydratase/2-oxohepta-3-ene-1,7-dioic acid hydratase in catechol pathway
VKLARCGDSSSEGARAQPGLVDASGRVRSLAGIIDDIVGETLSPARLAQIGRLAMESLPTIDAVTSLSVPIGGIGKIIGVGLNYRDHAQETGLPLPQEPTLFLKATSALAGPNDPLVMPRGAHAVDWEVELAVVIGTPGLYIDERRAIDHVAGYCVGIDFSERDFQFNRGGQGFKGKSADSFAPLGPWLVTRDEVSDPHNLTLQLSINGATRQHGSTKDMIFSVPQLVAYVSHFMSLQAGDVILTGTPAGVGMGQNPKTYLCAGDEVTATIDGLGTQTHRVVAAQ